MIDFTVKILAQYRGPLILLPSSPRPLTVNIYT